MRILPKVANAFRLKPLARFLPNYFEQNTSCLLYKNRPIKGRGPDLHRYYSKLFIPCQVFFTKHLSFFIWCGGIAPPCGGGKWLAGLRYALPLHSHGSHTGLLVKRSRCASHYTALKGGDIVLTQKFAFWLNIYGPQIIDLVAKMIALLTQ